MFHAHAERGLNGCLHLPECSHDPFRANGLAALPHVSYPSFLSLARQISLAPHPRYGCLLVEETSVPTRRDVLATAGLAPIARARPVRAHDGYPERPIRILVGYPAGGGVDIVARLFAEPMKAALGQSVIVENRAGASGMIAAAAVAKSPPDGLTLLMAASGEVAINQHLYKDKMSYDPPRELVAVALIGIVPCVVVVATATPVRTAAELIAYARANRGRLSFSSSGIGNPQQLAGELMNRHRRAARALSRRGAGGHRRRDRYRHHELFESRRRAAANPGRPAARRRRHFARAHAAVARRGSARRGSGRAQGLRTPQLVRPVRARRHAEPDRRAPQ